MSNRRRGGRGIRDILLDWDQGQTDAERLALQLLHIEGYVSLDPIHPRGGRDGKKDIICFKDGLKWVAAVFFPWKQKTFLDILEKFRNDLKGVKLNNAQGFIFVTNRDLEEGQREQLRKEAGDIAFDLFHLERIVSLLNYPECYGLRIEFLGIELTQEELLAFITATTKRTEQLQALLYQAVQQYETIHQDIQELIRSSSTRSRPQYNFHQLFEPEQTQGTGLASFLIGVQNFFLKLEEDIQMLQENRKRREEESQRQKLIQKLVEGTKRKDVL